MFSKTQDKNLRNFINYGNKNNSNGGLQSMEEPTFFGFHIFFDWTNIRSKSDPEEVVPGLLLDAKDPDSAVNYLLRKGKDAAAVSLKKFNEILKDIEKTKPWMFQSVEGLNTIWGGLKPGLTWRGQDVLLNVTCLETLDTRMSFLAALYNNAAFDKAWQRTNLPFNKRRFNCTIIVSDNRNIGEILQKESTLASTVGLTKSTFTDLDKKITFYVFELEDCEFIFNDIPFMESLSVNNVNEAATFKFQIKVGYPNEAHQFRFFNWLVNNDYDKLLVNPNDSTIHPKVKFDQKQSYDDKTILHYEAKTKSRTVSYSADEVESRTKESEEALKNQTGGNKGNTWDAAADMYKGAAKMDAAVSKASGGKISSNKVAQKEVAKAKQQLEQAKLRKAQGTQLSTSIQEMDLKDPYSVISTAGTAYKISKTFDKTKVQTNWGDGVPAVVKTKDDILYRVVRELNSGQTTNNRFWKNVSQKDWKNVGLESKSNLSTSASSKFDYLSTLKRPTPDDKNLLANNIRTKSGAELKAQTRLGITSNKDSFKNTLYKGDYLKQYSHPNKNDEPNLKYRAIRTIYDVPNNPSGIFTQKPGIGGERKDWKNLGLNLNNSQDILMGSSRFNYLRRFKNANLKTSEGGINFGYSERVTTDGKRITNIYSLSDKTQVNNKLQPIKLTNGYQKSSISDITLEGPNPNNKLTPIKLEGPDPNKNLSPIKLEGPDPNKKLSPVKLEGPDPNKNLSPIKLEGPDPNKKLSPVKLEGPDPNKKLTPVKLEGPDPNKKLSPVKLQGPNPNKKLTAIKYTGNNKKPSLTKIVRNSKLNQGKIIPIKLTKTEPLKQLTPIKLESQTQQTKLTALQLNSNYKKQQLTSLKFDQNNNKLKLTKLSLTQSAVNDKLTPIQLEGAKPNTKITNLNLSPLKVNDKLTAIKLTGAGHLTKFTTKHLTMTETPHLTKLSEKNVYGK